MSEEQTYPQIERRQSGSIAEQIKVFHALLGIFGFLIIQTAGIAWWAATIQQKVEGNSTAILNASDDRYRKSQAISDFTLRDERLENLSITVRSEISQISKSLEKIEKNVEKLAARI